MRLLRDCGPGLGLLLLLGAPADAADLALKRVMLSSGGVGYFEYEATVDGDAALTLDVPLNQVDDVLKSLVVYDDGGRAGEITLPGREPLAQGFVDLPFDQSALASATSLLNALQGAQVRIAGDKPLAGHLVQAEDDAIRNSDGSSDTRLRLSVMSDDGLRQVTVKDLDAIEFADPKIAGDIQTALSRVATYRAQGRRQLTLTTHGKGQRNVRIGYVIAMPLWKATYRLNLPADAAATTARLQGWAVLENFSGQSWNDVELTLLSGNPVTFRQALYESYYVPRPTVPVESGSRVLPPVDSGVLDEATASKASENAPAGGMLKQAMRSFPVGAPASVAATTAAPAMPAPAPPPAQIEQAAAAEDSTQIAFTLPYKITVAAGQSLVVPLIDRELPGRQIDLYRPATPGHHPLAAIELTNAAETGLPPGVVTLYRQGDSGASYLGDARLSATPAGQKRLLNYAVDEKVTVDQSTGLRQSIVKATVAEGVMHLTRLQRRSTVYTVSSAAPPPGLIIEQSKLGGWKLTAPDTAERTADAYRVPAPLDAKGNGTVTLVEEEPSEETIALADLGDDQLGVYVSATEIEPKLHQALGDLALRRRAVGKAQAELDRLTEERAHLTDDEERLRDNYTAMKDDPAMRKTTLDKLKVAETAIDANAAGAAKASAALDTAKADLAGYIAGLKL
jgi:hypothetical protein